MRPTCRLAPRACIMEEGQSLNSMRNEVRQTENKFEASEAEKLREKLLPARPFVNRT